MLPRIKRRWGFKSKTQLPLFMIWEEHWYGGEVEYAHIIFTTSYLREAWFWRGQFHRLRQAVR